MDKKLKPLSQRTAAILGGPPRPDMNLFIEASKNRYHPFQNPDGAITLNVAENVPMIGHMARKVSEVLQSEPTPEWIYTYTDPSGYPEVREVFADFFNRHFGPAGFAPENIALSAGAAAIIEVSTYVLGDPGDVVVLPAPAYPMYSLDFGLKSGLERYNWVREENESTDEWLKSLNSIYDELDTKGKRFRILLLTSPDNPTGQIYSPHQLNSLADWCIQKEVHLIVNEIYGLSVFGKRETSFAHIMAKRKSDYLHWWYAMSKDFAMSGFRLGMVHSFNESFLNLFGNTNIPHMVSNLTQWLMGEVMKDEDFIEFFLRTNKRCLKENYELVASTLTRCGIPFRQAEGSFFVWADFSRFLLENSIQGENELWEEIFRSTGVLLTPGQGFGHHQKGFFRIVHTAAPLADLQVAVQRLESFFIRKLSESR